MSLCQNFIEEKLNYGLNFPDRSPIKSRFLSLSLESGLS